VAFYFLTTWQMSSLAAVDPMHPVRPFGWLVALACVWMVQWSLILFSDHLADEQPGCSRTHAPCQAVRLAGGTCLRLDGAMEPAACRGDSDRRRADELAEPAQPLKARV